MGKYEWVWTVVAATLLVAGFTAALQGWPLVVVLAVSLTGGMFGLLTALPWLPWSSSWGVAVVKVLAITSGVVWVVMGVTHVAGLAGLVVAVVVALGCPALGPAYASLMAKAGWRMPHLPGSSSKTTGAEAPAAAVATLATASLAPLSVIVDAPSLDVPDLMTTEDLCHAWRSSYVALQRAESIDSRLRVVRMRALYLDELERRAEPAVQAWLSSGARAASDPSRFLTRSRRRTPRLLTE